MHNCIPLMSCDHGSATRLGCNIRTTRTRKCNPFDQTLSHACMKGAGHETMIKHRWYRPISTVKTFKLTGNDLGISFLSIETSSSSWETWRSTDLMPSTSIRSATMPQVNTHMPEIMSGRAKGCGVLYLTRYHGKGDSSATPYVGWAQKDPAERCSKILACKYVAMLISLYCTQ